MSLISIFPPTPINVSLLYGESYLTASCVGVVSASVGNELASMGAAVVAALFLSYALAAGMVYAENVPQSGGVLRYLLFVLGLVPRTPVTHTDNIGVSSTAVNTTTGAGPSDEQVREVHGIKHLAVIMDGNRRFGKALNAGEAAKIADALAADVSSSPETKGYLAGLHRAAMSAVSAVGGGDVPSAAVAKQLLGHKAGGEKLIEFIGNCIDWRISILSVYAFSTENWSRPKVEVDLLMALFSLYFDRLLSVAAGRGIYVRFVVSDLTGFPAAILDKMRRVERETRDLSTRNIVVNVCLGYGSQQELLVACSKAAAATPPGSPISEKALREHLLVSLCQSDVAAGERDAETVRRVQTSDPDILLRTSGEQRLSNFMLFQCAYSELFFTAKAWPEVTAADFRDMIVEYTHNRARRFGR